MHQFGGGTPFGSVTGFRAMFSNVICSAVTATVLLLAAAPPSCWSYGIAGEIPKWWQNTIIYEIYPQSFYDSDNDGFGDLRGVAEKVSYLQELRVGAIWLNPFYKSPLKDNGYDVSDFRKIDKRYGTMEDFEYLLETLKYTSGSNPIELIMDFVPNHTSDQHEWFKKSVQKIEPYTDYYVWKDPKGYDGEGKPIPPNNWESIFAVGRPGSAWEWNPERKQFYYHAFMVEQPDLNFRNPKVIEELKDIMKFWMDKGVQGWRLDAVPHLIEDEELRDEHGNHDKTQNLPETYKIIEDFRAFIDAYSEENYVNIFLTTEGYAGPQETVKYYGTDGRVGAHFPFNFLLLTDFNAETKALNIKNTIQSYLDRLDDFKFPNWVSGNHDWPRIPSRMGASSATDIVNIMNLLLPGTSTVFMGDELGMDSYWNLDREACPSGVGDDYRTPARTPFHWNSSKNAGFTQASKPWVPVNPEYYRTNVEVERTLRSKYQTSHLENFKSLAALKRENAFMYGELKMYDLTEYVFAFTRQDDNNIYLAIMNLGKGFSDPFVLEREIPDLAQASPRKIVMRSVNLQSECSNVSSCYDSLTSGEWSMPPKSGMVLSFRKSWRPSRRNTPISGRRIPGTRTLILDDDLDPTDSFAPAGKNKNGGRSNGGNGGNGGGRAGGGGGGGVDSIIVPHGPHGPGCTCSEEDPHDHFNW
nr:PREDICTED: maltase A1-like isoform X2 [Bemisia tabaci]